MNNLQLVEKVLYYIDEHIDEELTYERLAEVFGYSSFHFHKICQTTETIADICYSVGFNSIQTFNRAFKDTFGMQPLVARETQAKITYRSVAEIITGYLKRVEVNGVFAIEPKIVTREEFVVAGYRKHTRNGFGVIGEAWFELKSSMDSIQRKNEHTMYGFEDYSEEFTAEPLVFYYMAGVEVDKETKLPEGMYRKIVPKAEYAVFTVSGNSTDGYLCTNKEIGGIIMAFCDLFKEFQPIQVDEEIYLRQHEPEKDARPFWEIYSDVENFKFFSGYGKPSEWNEEREIRAEASRVKGFKGKREYSWVVTYRGEVIGQIQLFNFFNHNTCAEIGYFIKKSYWNRGINTKVLKAVCRFGMETMELERMEAYAHVDNIGSNRTLQKAGFTKEGLMRKRFRLQDTLGDCNVYSFVRADLEKITE